MNIVVINSGSSSLKISMFQAGEGKTPYDALWETEQDFDWQHEDQSQIEEKFKTILNGLYQHGKPVSCAEEIDSIGHRIVHGGADFTTPVVIDPQVETKLAQLEELAPLHNPINMKALRAAQKLVPRAKHVAVFDTGFHSTLPKESYVYPVPYEWLDKYKIRKYGFHGINHQYCSQRAGEILQSPSLRIVSCHLGGGCSLAAIEGGKSIETTMGFTPLEGLMMRSRCGSIDAGILFYLVKEAKLEIAQLDIVLNRESGLKGIYEKTGDMKEIVAARLAGDERAGLAFDMFVHRLCAGIAAMTASLKGLDVLIFTGGIGEHSAEVRLAVCQRLQYLGVSINSQANDTKPVDKPINNEGSKIKTLVLKAREDWQIAMQVLRLLENS